MVIISPVFLCDHNPNTMALITLPRKLSYAYLLAVPLLVSVLAFGIGHITPSLYIPLWLLNTAFMTLASRLLAVTASAELRWVLWPSIVPWILIAVFGFMGPPPDTIAGWAALAHEQVLRFSILIVCGLLVGVGAFRLNRYLSSTPGSKWAKTGYLLIRIALPFFLLDMAYWGYFITYEFVQRTNPGAAAKPAWLKPLATIFTGVRMTDMSLIYLATAAFVLALKASGYMSGTASRIYVAFACLGAVCNLLPDNAPGFLSVMGYLSAIPAYALLMLYLVSVNLLTKEK